MSHESTSSSSTGSYFAHGLPSPPAGGNLHYSDDITYTGPFNPSPFELLFLVNTGGHNDALRNTSLGQPHLQFAIDSLIRLQAQRASLNAIIEETNVYAANLAFNATANGPNPLIVEGPMTVPSFPVNSERLEFQLHAQLSGLGPFPMDIFNADPNDPTFIRAAETYRARIGAAVELALDQNQLCPRHSGTEPVLPRPASSPTLVPKLKPLPSPDSSSGLTYPSDSPSRDSSPIYAQSIGVATASPSPPCKPQPQPAPPPPIVDPFNVNNEPLAPPHSTFSSKWKIQLCLRQYLRHRQSQPRNSY
ncbi:hypothetical protein Moror_4113 [Moniliophthora roreri MCA 2997]|uniref:Uncharacterized protein n=1 Tax=Moniliophthora roreri (strain MCA 2997) TaxID=1381753 RepID=V2WV44_MONRO|nr:hypothetical protein Moror_4113 [Moniliophthora roreri MCA 2997]